MNMAIVDKFAKDFQIMDNNLTSELVTTAFTGSQTTLGKIAGALESHLLRFQFIELIVRLANAKYREPGLVKLHSEALKLFIDNDINPHADEYNNQWGGFRENQLWKMECNDLFKPNVPSIERLMKRLHEPRKAFQTMDEAVKIFSHET